MAMDHRANCDGQHTPRQPCNDALAGHADAVVIEAQSANGATGHEDSVTEDRDRAAISRPAVATQEMPAPSPGALRAWEETAAAVGATATPAPPARAIVEGEVVRERGWFAGHAALVAIAAAVALAVLVIARRRRPRGDRAG